MLANNPVMVPAKDAKRELARRELARRHLVDFSSYIAPYYKAAAHHRLVGEYLELVETYLRTKGQTGIGRLLILEPPRHGKSEQMSRHFPAWVLGQLPDTRIILTSYNADLAAKFSRAARDIVLSTEYRAIFGDLANSDSPIELSEDSRSVKAWDLAAPHRGGMMSAGVGGGITGSGANLFLVDDPFKNREEAESESHRKSVWEWWTSTAYTRLEDGAAVIGSLTRWHGDDWAGRLLKAMATDPKADRWVLLSLPAVWEPPAPPKEKSFEAFRQEQMLEGIWIEERDPLDRRPGQALWPEKYNEEDLERIRVNVGEYDYEALYQQSPYSRTGNFFRREWFTIVEAPPKVEDIVARMWFWDKAGSQTGDGDYAAGGVLSLTKDELVYVENVARRQCTPGERDTMMIAVMQADLKTNRPLQCIWHQQDPASAGLDSAMATNKLLVKNGFKKIRFETVSGSKEVRAGPWSSALQGGMVRLVRGAWNHAFIEEHIGFPKAMFDDQVDFVSWGFAKLVGRRGRKEAKSYQG
jgi:predicted phage terminase large subunit-like protein